MSDFSKKEVTSVLISRTDNIGDVVLTLPMAARLKRIFPNCKVGFLCKEYTRPIVECSPSIDEIYCWHEATEEPLPDGYEVVIHVFPRKKIALQAWKQGFSIRIGTSHRWYHWITCNKNVNLSRKNSPLHESELNLRLLQPLLSKPEISSPPNIDEYTLRPKTPLSEQFKKASAKRVLIHPFSKGSAPEYPLHLYAEIIQILLSKKYEIYITGGVGERERIEQWCKTLPPEVNNIAGSMNLGEFCTFIAGSEGFIASSTGPLHIAASMGIKTAGLFVPRRPLDAGRWGARGKNVKNYMGRENCVCLEGECTCMEQINPKLVAMFFAP